ncbi:MFS transporter [Rhodoplanes sp. TEM]|uniref:MFS transporter n=1 Tax=Rhodoplanes tepidamans TaxID=200616 RepID=A0ABT5JJA0_RHOTP|nr:MULTISPECIES: MFS transporter [Rhodoplanes]MDC7789426.1 MFS transporter [Rhodoplanes tepidamans]MDC7987062.1 MFS transporter [Rhodoplanes sp. TEM]MDQ0353599.1 MFS family permease [Rhodoplanes tepidamans]
MPPSIVSPAPPHDPVAAAPTAVRLLLAGLVANAMGHAFVLIVLPVLGREMGFGDIRTGLLLSLAAVVLTVAGPVWGQASERLGRRRVLLLGLSAAAAFPAALAAVVEARLDGMLDAVTAFALLLAARLALSAVAGGVMPAAQAFLADATTAERRAGGMGLMGAAFGVGTIAGAALAFGAGGARPAMALWLLAGLVAAAALLVGRGLRDIRPAGAAVGRGTAALRWRAIAPFLLITTCGLSVYSLLQQVTALRLQDAFGMSPAESIRTSGAAMMITMAAMIVVQGLIVRRLGWPPARLLRLGAVVAALAMLVAALAPAVPVLIAGMVGLGAGFGLLLPGNLAALSLRAGPAAQGKAAGVNAVAQGIGMAIGPLAGAALHQAAPAAPWWASLAVLLIAVGLAFRRRTFAD